MTPDAEFFTDEYIWSVVELCDGNQAGAVIRYLLKRVEQLEETCDAIQRDAERQ